MAEVQKQDSNQTGLRMAIETSIGVLPGTPIWIPLEPNSYSDFGGEISTVARNPINAGRQRQKGVTTDLDASAGYQSDLILDETLRQLLQAFFFSSFREQFDTAPVSGGSTVVDVLVDGAGNDYESAAFGMDLNVFPGHLLFASGFSLAANNGLKVVASTTADTSIAVTDVNLVNEVAKAANRLTVVGYQFPSGALNVNATPGDLPRIEQTGLVAASLELTITSIVNLDGETVTIGGQVYTFQSALSSMGTVANEVLIGANLAAAVDNLAAAINAGAGAGVTYGSGTVANEFVTAVSDGVDGVVVTAKISGVYGNAITVAEALTDGSWAGAATALGGGVGMAFTALNIPAGSWIYVGGDSAPLRFADPANRGYVRVKEVGADYLILDKTQSDFVDETGTGLTVQVFLGHVIKNEAEPTLQRRRTLQFERLLGAPDDSQPTQIQAEYVVGSVANQMQMNFATADKVTVDFTFVATNNEQRTAVQGPKSGTRPPLSSGDAFNTTSHFARLKMSILDPVDSNPTRLFAFLTEFNLVVNNNVSPNKAISVLGAFEVTAGQFNVDGESTAYFSKVEAIQAVRNNEDVTLDFILFKDNAGVAVDVPLIALGNARLNVEQDQPITLPLSMPAAADRVFNHTLLMVFFRYLPTLAAPA